MTEASHPGTSADFEFEALTVAVNYRAAIVEIFKPYLHGDVIELGAGIGQMSELFVKLTALRSFMAVEPNKDYCQAFTGRLPNVQVHEGTMGSLNPSPSCDAIVSINVFEHIEDDQGELATCHRLLKPRNGAVCLLVPARPEIYAPIDADFGHFRRYTPHDLRSKLTKAGYKVEALHYFNFVGYFAWLFNFKILGARVFSVPKLRFFDQHIFPIAYGLEKALGWKYWGQSLIAVARA